MSLVTQNATSLLRKTITWLLVKYCVGVVVMYYLLMGVVYA